MIDYLAKIYTNPYYTRNTKVEYNDLKIEDNLYKATSDLDAKLKRIIAPKPSYVPAIRQTTGPLPNSYRIATPALTTLLRSTPTPENELGYLLKDYTKPSKRTINVKGVEGEGQIDDLEESGNKEA
ncbi:hypothetical protein G7Y89_g14743 [Cudoniella acicularis]|uniref:Uncharacterized protein n=1 Tax=Cudoniella acicularis TaxID=354080 RepID=A0A8H4QYE0_9HELO|nr:hypothetical protein G7Y89_g14743 [Cudoniella acicularis]